MDKNKFLSTHELELRMLGGVDYELKQTPANVEQLIQFLQGIVEELQALPAEAEISSVELREGNLMQVTFKDAILLE